MRARLTPACDRRSIGAAIEENLDLADDADVIVLVSADRFSNIDLEAVVAHHLGHGDVCTMVLAEATEPGVGEDLELDSRGCVMTAKKAFAGLVDDHAPLRDAGIIVVSPDGYRRLGDCRGRDFSLRCFGQAGIRPRGLVHNGAHQIVDTYQSYERADAQARRLVGKRGQGRGGLRPAVFLDRDGTLIESVHYLSDPAEVVLVAECAPSLARLRKAGFALVVVTNQAAIGKGIIDEVRLAEIHGRMHDLLCDAGCAVDAVYFCPQPGKGRNRLIIEHPDRKPGPGMLRRGAEAERLDISRSYMIGDVPSDVLAGYYAGCKASLLIEGSSAGHGEQVPRTVPYVSVASLAKAVDWILSSGRTLD